jgi:membrane associated rhomboid family serine protease
MAVPKEGPDLWKWRTMHDGGTPVAVQAPRERKLITSAVIPAIVVLVLLSIYFLDGAFDLDLYRFGTYPRSAQGLIGIITSPFIHGDLEHVLNNSVPLFVLGWALLYFFPHLAGRVVLGSWLVSGVWVWLSARANFHIGASGVVYGLAAFLFTSGLLRKQRTLMGLSLLVVFLYGGLLWGMFPLFPSISWESHFWGAAAGVALAFIYRNVPSAVRDPREIRWEDEEEEGPAPELSSPSTADEGDEEGARSWRTSHTWQEFTDKVEHDDRTN